TCLRWLTRAEPDVNESADAAKRTVKDVTRAAEIIGRLRALFEKSASTHEWVAITDLITEIVVLVRSEALRYGISIRTDFAVDLPRVRGDRIQLQQVILNLLMNSIEATKEVDGQRDIVVTAIRDDHDHLLVSVADTGIGLPAKG